MTNYEYLKKIDYIDEGGITNELLVIVNEKKALEILPTIELTKEEIKNILDGLNLNWDKKEEFFNFRNVEKNEETKKTTQDIAENKHSQKLIEMFDLYNEINLLSKKLNSKPSKIHFHPKNGLILNEGIDDLSLDGEKLKELIHKFNKLLLVYPDFFEKDLKKYTTSKQKIYYVLFSKYGKILEVINPNNPKEKIRNGIKNVIEDNFEKITPIIKDEKNFQILKVHNLYKSPNLKQIVKNDFSVFTYKKSSRNYKVYFQNGEIKKVLNNIGIDFKKTFFDELDLKMKNGDFENLTLDFYIDNNFISGEIKNSIEQINSLVTKKSSNQILIKNIENFADNIYEFLAYKKENLSTIQKLETISKYLKRYIPNLEENTIILLETYNKILNHN